MLSLLLQNTGLFFTIGVLLLIALFVYLLYAGIKVISEKEVMIIERFGTYRRTLQAGISFVLPFIDQPKTFWFRYYETTNRGGVKLNERYNVSRISTVNEVIDFPRQNVITRDNAAVYLDAVLNYKVSNPKLMIYSCINLPYMLSKLLQAQIRNVAGSLDIDQMIEDAASLNRISTLMKEEAQRWGVFVEWVKIQKIEASGLTDVLARKKNADLKNQEIIIGAKANRQTTIINAEGTRDSLIRTAEGHMTEMIARARGQAQAITNQASAEARSIKEIAKLVSQAGENPARYLLSLKYLDALKSITDQKRTTVKFLPYGTTFVQTSQALGLNSVVPSKK